MSQSGRITTVASLLEALDHRGDDLLSRQTFDQRIWEECGQKGAILVTDLSGFTRLTKKHGILHFLAVFRRCERLCLPVIPQYGGALMKHEADDLIVIFPTAAQAIGAGLEMLRVTAVANQALELDDQIGMCIGVESGTLIRLQDDAFGDPVNVAFKLGEDVASRGELLIGPKAWQEATAANFDFRSYRVDGPRKVEAGQVELEHYAVMLR